MGELSILEQPVMTKMVEEFPPIAELIGPSIFKPEPINSETATWDEITFGRGKGQWTKSGSPAKNIALMGMKKRTSVMMEVKDELEFPPDLLKGLRSPGTYETPYLERCITDNMRNLDAIQQRTIEAARWAALTTGHIVVAQADYAFDYDFGIAGTHLVTVGALWSDPSLSDVLGDLKTARRLIREDGAENATEMYMNEYTENLMLQDGKVRDYLKTQYGRELVAGETPAKVGKLNVHIYDEGYVDSGTFYPYIPNGKVVILAQTQDAFIQQNGISPVPTGQPNSYTFVNGKYSFNYMPGGSVVTRFFVQGQALLPIIKKINNIVVLTVT